uniref:Transmembrane protein n=1 Tax=Kalanchoe fedtschenkoi TaxID=63787 RepID=A0A7N0UWS1_KALFE
MMRRPTHQDPQSTVFYDLSSLVLTLLRSPTLPVSASSPPRLPPKITPSGVASLMFGISLAMMLCGSVTFLIGFMLMPWAIGFVVVLYIVGLVSGISMLARALLCHITAVASRSRKDLPGSQFFDDH